MKIIATAGTGKFIVEATEYELVNVMGYGYPCEIKPARLDVGYELQVSQLYKALAVERGRRAEVATLATKLRQAADRVDSINAALDCPIVEPSQS